MDWIDQYQQVETRMEESFQKNRFDTFTQLMSERLKILRTGANSSDRTGFLATAKPQTEQWIIRLTDRIQEEKVRRKQTQALTGGYRRAPRSGKVINKTY